LHMVQLMPLHPKTASSFASFKPRLVSPFSYRITKAILEKRLLNVCVCVYINFMLDVRRGGSVADWLACWTQAHKGPGSNRSCDAVR